MQMKAIEQFFYVVLFIMLYKVVLTSKFVDETSVCDHANESYWAVLLCSTDNYSVDALVPLLKALDETFVWSQWREEIHVSVC